MLDMLVLGSGSPTVIFESGLGSDLSSWQTVQSSIALFTRTVAYNRAGIGSSPAPIGPRTARAIAADLRAELLHAKVSPPFICVGHSIGGIFIRVFAGEFPEDVVGLVLIDPSTEEIDDWVRRNRPDLVEDIDDERTPSGVREELRGIEESFHQARSTGFPVCPTIVMTGARCDPVSGDAEYVQVKQHAHANWVNKLPRAKHVVAKNSGHYIHHDEPWLVIDAVRDVIASL